MRPASRPAASSRRSAMLVARASISSTVTGDSTGPRRSRGPESPAAPPSSLEHAGRADSRPTCPRPARTCCRRRAATPRAPASRAWPPRTAGARPPPPRTAASRAAIASHPAAARSRRRRSSGDHEQSRRSRRRLAPRAMHAAADGPTATIGAREDHHLRLEPLRLVQVHHPHGVAAARHQQRIGCLGAGADASTTADGAAEVGRRIGAPRRARPPRGAAARRRGCRRGAGSRRRAGGRSRRGCATSSTSAGSRCGGAPPAVQACASAACHARRRRPVAEVMRNSSPAERASYRSAGLRPKKRPSSAAATQHRVVRVGERPQHHHELAAARAPAAALHPRSSPAGPAAAIARA